MTRQRLGEKKVKKLREKTGLPIVKVTVRGGEEHCLSLCLEDGSIMRLWPDGTMKHDGKWDKDG